jgi:hypothetical protein
MKTKNTLVFFTLVCLFFTAAQTTYAQKTASLFGHVKYLDSTCAGLAITIDSVYKTTTDNAGFFEIRGVPYGKSKFEIYSKGNRIYKRTLHVNQETLDMPISLDAAALELEEIVINKNLHLNGPRPDGTYQGNISF